MKPAQHFLLGLILMTSAVSVAQTTTLKWQGYTWHVKSGPGMGPGPNSWDPHDVWVDDKGLLHLKLAETNGKWSCAELWTVQNLGYGTYQCQVEATLDELDPNVVFAMFPYDGPDGTREIDVEFAKWGNAKESNLWWTVYPEATSGKTGQHKVDFKLNGTYTTSRFDWTKTGVEYWFMGGHQPLGKTDNVTDHWKYEPSNPGVFIPQKPMPLHFNLWLFQGKAPLNGKPVEIIVHRFEMAKHASH